MKVLRERTELLLMEYASGALDEACSMLMASYITLCPEARRYYRQCEALGGAFIEECNPVAMQSGSMRAVLDKLDIPEECKDKVEKDCGFCEQQTLPRPVSITINHTAPKARWHKVTQGFQYYNMPEAGSCYKTMLLKMAPNARVPAHSHQGVEMTLVIEGSYSDEYGSYKAGDFIIIDEPAPHRPVAGPQGCVCLVASETPVRYKRTITQFISFIRRS